MSNGYGFRLDDKPAGKYGIYDVINGEWTGDFFATEKDAETAIDERKLDREIYCIESTDDDA